MLIHRLSPLAMMSRKSRRPAANGVGRRLFAPVDIAGLVYFRIAFYAIMLWEVWRFMDHGRVERYFTAKPFYFTYWPLDFIRPLPGDGMEILFWGMGLAAIFAMLSMLRGSYLPRFSETQARISFSFAFGTVWSKTVMRLAARSCLRPTTSSLTDDTSFSTSSLPASSSVWQMRCLAYS